MNALMQQLLEQVLRDNAKAWDHKTSEPRLSYINSLIENLASGYYFDMIFVPRAHRAARLLAAIAGNKKHVYQGSFDNEPEDLIIDYCGERCNVPELVSEIIDAANERYYWNHPEIQLESITKEDILSMNIPIKLVADKPNQPSMF